MQTHTITSFDFAELSDEAKRRALEDNREFNVFDEWYDAVYEDAKTIAGLMGIEINNIYFSGFASQGDGACFEGRYTYRKGSVKAVKEYAPKDETLHRIAADLREIQAKHFYRLEATVKHSGHYSHEYETEIRVYNGETGDYTDTETEDGITEALRNFMRWIYRSLEAEYEYQTSDEAIIEGLEANEMQFKENGAAFNC